MKYIERFSSLIPALQGNKVVQKIEEKRSRGEIKTEAEYNAALQEILSGLSTQEFKPTFNFIPFQAEISSSEHFNLMMDQIRDDLEVAFIEINNIFATIKAHDTLFKDKLLDELHFTLKKIEDEKNELSIIGDIDNSFDNAFINSFNGENFIIDRSNPFIGELLFDKRSAKKIPDSYLAYIDKNEKSATLPLQSQKDTGFIDAAINTAETTVSEVDLQLVDSDIGKMLREDEISGWTHNILLDSPLKDGSKLSLELDLGDKKEINFLKIHPTSDYPVLLEKIQYINTKNEIKDLPDDSSFNRVIEDPIRITFPDIIAKKIILKLSQNSSVIFDYDKRQSKISFDDLRRNTSLKRDVSVLTDNIQETIQDPDILDVIPLTPSVGQDLRTYNLYVFAFKNIVAGLSKYKDEGFLIAKPQERGRVAEIAIDIDEIIPKVFSEELGGEIDTSSFEYDILKKDYDKDGRVISSKEFPILPIKASLIKNERLHFKKNQTIIPLRFIGHTTSNSGIGIKILRNGVELVRGTDWRFKDRVNPLNNSDANLLGGLYSTKIEILHSKELIKKGKYTADYIPRYISEPNEIVEENGIVYLPSGTTQHKVEKDTEKVIKSDIFLKVSIRNNSKSNNRTPKLKSYKILTSSVDEDKHVRIK